MAEFNTLHFVSLENAFRFFSGEICHIPVKFFMTIAEIFHNPSKASYVDYSSNFLLGSVLKFCALPVARLAVDATHGFRLRTDFAIQI